MHPAMHQEVFWCYFYGDNPLCTEQIDAGKDVCVGGGVGCGVRFEYACTSLKRLVAR